MAKRFFDLLVSILLLFATWPIFGIVAILVRTKLGKPVLFKQVRPGLHGKSFTLYKFRTMKDLLDREGRPLPDEVRLTSFGKSLRKYSLDEWPQLWNVVKGELSLVGPRPLLMEYMPLYNDRQARRHEVKPGMTGWAQVNGRNAIHWEEKFELDVWYVDNRSFWLDVKILWLTLLKVLRSEDINQAGHATVPDFTGNTVDRVPAQEEFL